jgi:D-psicose/D-tagatose/L-ribulose 3-epimerase
MRVQRAGRITAVMSVVTAGALALGACGSGGSHFTGALDSALGKYDRPLSDAGRRSVVTVLRRLAQDARRLGMTLGIEICNRYETDVVNTAHDALVDVGEDNVLIHLDVGENHRGYLGSGHLDFTSFFHALADVGYQGPITFESFSSAAVMAGLSSDLAIWRNLWSDGEDLARHARGFIAGNLAAGRGRR